ncbi:MAG: hypothetical protein CL773_04315 [Chloroflexi bacterium]|nr:hypothetical protein [Chloroflexota bacterium]|tara:strand:+ start:986 stop:1681 length:696 start_codon:yes stop_codon:yes gene_type:complete
MTFNQNFNSATLLKKKIVDDKLCFFEFKVENWKGHIPGQYSEICLTAENGYQAIRPYSIASPPRKDTVSFLIEKIDEGEVSNFLYDYSLAGDKFQISNPIGLRFILHNKKIPIFIASGSGIAPFLSMSKYLNEKRISYFTYHWSRNITGLVNFKENETNINISYFPFITREIPIEWQGGTDRIQEENFNNLDINQSYEIYICGSDSFVENALSIASNLNLDCEIFTERFGS